MFRLKNKKSGLVDEASVMEVASLGKGAVDMPPVSPVGLQRFMNPEQSPMNVDIPCKRQ